MYLRIVLFALQLTAVCASWVVPRDLEDGVHHILVQHDDNATTKPTLVKRLRHPEKIEFYHYDDMHDPDINKPDKWENNKDSFRKLPVHKKPGDHGSEGKIPFEAHDCIYNEPELLEDAYLQARANLFAYCTRWRLPARTVHISVAKQGDVIAYACSWSMWKNICSPREFTWVEEKFWDPKCGRLTPAWSASAWWQKTYGRGWIGSHICKTDIYGRYIPRVTKHVWVGLPPDVENDDQEPNRYKDGAKWEVKVAKEPE